MIVTFFGHSQISKTEEAEKADCVVAYVSHNWGGAYESCKYAKRKGKTVFNIAKKNL